MRTFLIIRAALFTSGPADAARYPSRPIIMVVPFAARGATEVIARIIAEPMSRKLGQPIIIGNVAGVGGAIGTAKVKAAAGDDIRSSQATWERMLRRLVSIKSLHTIRGRILNPSD